MKVREINNAPLSKFITINPENIFKNYPYSQIEYIDISSVASGYLNTKPQTLNLADAPSRAKRIVRDNDIILSTVRPNLRSFLYVKNPQPNTIVSTGFAVLRAKDKVDPRYIYYAISNPIFTGYLTNNAKGTSYPAVDTDIILRGEIPDFPYSKQEKIADRLSKYDDLIDNNNRRIALLEESVHLLYREWFVKMRFPGYESARFIDGIPEGWEMKKVQDFGTVVTGKTPSKKKNTYYGGDILFVKTPDMHGKTFILNTEEKLSEEGSNSQKNQLISPYSIMVSCIGTVGVVAFSTNYCQTNQQINSVIPNNEYYRYYLYFFFKNIREYLQALGSNGATMTNVNKTKFSNISILKPHEKELIKFHQFSESYFKQILNLQKQNQKLKEARDGLLARLMNGNIEV